MNGAILDPNIGRLGPKNPLEAQKRIKHWFFGRKGAHGSLMWLQRAKLCYSISTNYPTMSGTLLDHNMCLLGPKKTFGGPKTDQILIVGPKKVRTAPLCNYRLLNLYIIDGVWFCYKILSIGLKGLFGAIGPRCQPKAGLLGWLTC